MLSGPEMLLKSLGIDFKQIDLIVKEIVSGLKKNNETQALILERLTEIEKRLLPSPIAAPRLITHNGERENNV